MAREFACNKPDFFLFDIVNIVDILYIYIYNLYSYLS